MRERKMIFVTLQPSELNRGLTWETQGSGFTFLL